MIAPLRRRHRWLAPGAFALAAVGLALGVMARPLEFVKASRAFDATAPMPVRLKDALRSLPGEPRMSVAFDAQARGFWLVPEARIEAADVLAYATRLDEWEGDLPADARLLGEVAPEGATFLPRGGTDPLGVVLYSLGQKRPVKTISATDLIGGGD